MKTEIVSHRQENIRTTPTSSSTEQRSIIEHCQKMSMTPTEALKFMQRDETSQIPGTIFVYCQRRFWETRKIRMTLHELVGRRWMETNERIRDIIISDRQKLVAEISEMVHPSIGCIHNIILKQLNLHKVSAHCVPRLLTDVDKDR